MKKWIFCLGLLSCSWGVQAEETFCDALPSADVPLSTWIEWRDEQIAFLLTPLEHEGNTYIEILGVAERALCLREKLRSLSLDKREEVKSALQNFIRFVEAVSWQADPKHEMGFPIPDLAYVEAVRAQITLPDLLRSSKFLEAVSDPKGYADAMAMIDGYNAERPLHQRWVTLFYQSRFIETPDRTTHGRLLVWVPGNPEQWIQFGILTPDLEAETQTHGVSIVALWTGENSQQQVAVVDYWRSYQDGEVILQTKVEAGEGGANCYNCHKTGVLPIYPHQTFSLNANGGLEPSLEAGAVLKALNKRIKKHQIVQYGFGFDEAAYGPSVGPSDYPRDLDRIKAWIQPLDLSVESLKRVRKAMDCTQCHDGAEVGRLNFPSALVSDQDHIDLIHPQSGVSMPLLHEHVVQAWMPPDQSLNSAEREALYRALMKEYHDPALGVGVLVDWLKNLPLGSE